MQHLLTSIMFVSLSIGNLTGQGSNQTSSADALARVVTIYRDAYGTPHVFGKSDASTVFGLAYAQAEDNFAQVEEDFGLAIGRGAEIYGSELIDEDRLNRALEIERFAKSDYDAIDPKMRGLCDAFAAGINFYLQHHPNVHPQLLTRIEAWYPLAFIRYSYYEIGYARDPKLGSSPLLTSHVFDSVEFQNGSNGWVIAPSRSATGHAMLFIDPHLPFFGRKQVYEAHIHSDEGWDFSGYARFGFPFPYVGHNPNIGWASTDNAADSVDGYVEHFDDPKNPLSYRYGDNHKLAEEHTEVIRVKTSTGVEPRTFRMLRTIHGPILTSFEGHPVAVRLPKYDSHGWLPEWYEMTHARNLAELKAALSHLDMLFGNVMSADRDGNIFYVYNAAVPRRDEQFDWSHPVDGSDPRTEWKGYYPFEKLPQLTNPATGWIENCNTSPFFLTSSGNPDPKDYPKYMVREAGPDANNPRGRASQRILGTTTRFSFDDWKKAVFDTHVIMADELLPEWLATLRKSAIDSTVAEAVQELERWDHRSTADSVAMTVFTLWDYSIWRTKAATPETFNESLRGVLADLSKQFGTWRVPYGNLNRLQRSVAYGKPPFANPTFDPPFGSPTFDDDESSLPIAAVPNWEGSPFTMYSVPGKQGRQRYGVHGDTYVSVVEFGATTNAASIMTFGESADPKSKHFFDQAPLYVKGQFKPSWMTLEEVKQHSESAYHPGEEANH
jgi:acyl-homoserine-lactone acylase